MRYTPHTPDQIALMLAKIGEKEIGGLYSDVPRDLMLSAPPDIEGGYDEPRLIRHLGELAESDFSGIGFAGAGSYSHHSPAAVGHIMSLSGLYTSYTPYQAEVSQGVLQALFEYQSMMAQLCGKDICNATMYDGSTALAEAAVMARNMTRRDEIVAADSLHPHYLSVLSTYCAAGGMEFQAMPLEEIAPSKDTAAVIVQSPDYWGTLHDSAELFKAASDAGARSIALCLEMTSLGLVSPAAADIFAGDGQALGLPTSFGGPSFGVLCACAADARRMPGRLVGQTADSKGRRGYILTLQTREQHIRRQRATSNICTSQSLCGIGAAAYLALLGPSGLGDVARASHLNANYLMEGLLALPGFGLAHPGPIYNEFTMSCPKGTYEAMIEAGFGPPVRGGEDMLIFATTEMHRKADLDALLGVLS